MQDEGEICEAVPTGKRPQAALLTFTMKKRTGTKFFCSLFAFFGPLSKTTLLDSRNSRHAVRQKQARITGE